MPLLARAFLDPGALFVDSARSGRDPYSLGVQRTPGLRPAPADVTPMPFDCCEHALVPRVAIPRSCYVLSSAESFRGLG